MVRTLGIDVPASDLWFCPRGWAGRLAGGINSTIQSALPTWGRDDHRMLRGRVIGGLAVWGAILEG